MIAFAQQPMTSKTPDWQAGFLELLPDILNQLRFQFRNLRPEERAEAMAEAVANAAVAYARLHRQGKVGLAYPTPLSRFAAAQYRAGRRVGVRCNINDVMSPTARRRHGLKIERLDRFDRNAGWKEVLVEDRRCTPAELAASRIDFESWLCGLPRQKRRIAKALAIGEATGDVARGRRLTPGRISQIRRELAEDWRCFVGESDSPPGR
jgi:hypothetical protein